MYTIYSYFNITQIQSVLNAVVMLMGSGGASGDYLSLLRIAGMMGMMIAVVGGMVKARGEDAGMYMVFMAIFYSVLFTPRVEVTIEDAGFGTGAPAVVANVPLGLAFFASSTSKIGHWFTDATETFFSLPDPSLRFASSGLMGGSRLLRESSGSAIQSPVLMQDLVNFMRDCVNPEIVMNPLSLNSLMDSKTIWSDFNALGLINPGRLVTLASSGVPDSCLSAYLNLGTSINTEAATGLARLGQLMNPNAPPAAALTLVTAMLPAAEGLMMASSASAQAAIQQRMMINLLNDQSASLAQVLGDPTAAQNAAAAALAAKSANSSYVIMAKLASEALPMIRNSIELICIGIFPIVLVLIIIAGSKGGLVLKSYVLTMLWVELWAPIYAIVNYIGTLTAGKQLASALGTATGVTVINSAAVINTAISAEAVTGILTISVPMIALAIVKGGEVAMSGVVSSVMGPAQSAAQSSGGAAGVGNYNYANAQWGNGSFNSTMGNKTDTDTSIKSGAVTTRNSAGDTTTKYPDGTATVAQAKHDSLISGGMMSSFGTELIRAAGEKMSAGKAEIAAGIKSQNAVFAQLTDSIRGHVTSNSNQVTAGHKVGGAYQTDVTGQQGHTEDAAAKSTVSNSNGAQQQLRVTVGAQVGVEGSAGIEALGTGGKVKGSIDAGVAASQLQSYETKIGKALEKNDLTTASQLMGERQAYIEDLVKSNGFSHEGRGSTSGSKGVSATLSESVQHIDQARADFSEAKELTNSARILQAAGSSAGYNQSADPNFWSADEVQSFTNDLRAANHEGRVALLSGLARRIGGNQVGDHLPSSYMDGSHVVSDRAGLRAQHTEDAAAPHVANEPAKTYRGFQKRVNTGPVGAESERDSNGLQRRAEAYAGASRENARNEKARLGHQHHDNQTRVNAESGHVDNNSWNVRDNSTYAETVKLATASAARDAKLSLQQLVPNSLGGAPTLEQHMNTLGYDPGTTQVHGGGKNTQVSRPTAPPNWQPKGRAH